MEIKIVVTHFWWMIVCSNRTQRLANEITRKVSWRAGLKKNFVPRSNTQLVGGSTLYLNSRNAVTVKCHSINKWRSRNACHKTSSWSSMSLSKSISWSGSSCSNPGDICWWSMVVEADLGSSSFHLSIDLLRAFIKKLPTVVGSRPSCLAMVTCISFEGLFVSCNRCQSETVPTPGRRFTLKIACRVRRWRSVKTNRGFLGVGSCSELVVFSSFRLQPAPKKFLKWSVLRNKIVRNRDSFSYYY